MKNRWGYSGIFVVTILIFTTICLTTMNVFAANPYYHNKAKCLADSGGHGHIYSVNNYACEKAANSPDSAVGPNNTCASWLGPPGNSKSTTVTASVLTGQVDLKIYGMCTVEPDTTRDLWFLNDNGSIVGFNKHFPRSGWGSVPASEDAKLDIAKFIQGLTPTMEGDYYVYTRKVTVMRKHSDGATSAPDWATIKLIIGAVIPPPPDVDLCSSWTPSKYLTSNVYEGDTSVEIKIRNSDSRFAGHEFGEWGDGDIYARPNDNIEWYTCYYPGVQTTADTQVSSVNTTEWNETPELSTTTCGWINAVFKPLKDVANPFNNAYYLSTDDDGGATSGDTVGKTGLTIGDPSTEFSESNRPLDPPDDVGHKFTEVATTDKPIHAKVGFSNPSTEVWSGTCGACPCTTEGCTGTVPCWGKCCDNKYNNAPLANAIVNYGPTDDRASVMVPYNYENYTDVVLDDIPNHVYSGETIKVEKVGAEVRNKPNSLTIDSYTTKVPKAELRMLMYVSEHSDGERGSFIDAGSSYDNYRGCEKAGDGSKQCFEIDDKNTGIMPLNTGGDLYGWGDDNIGDFGDTYNAFDASAGDFVCFVSAIWPATSGDDGNYQDQNGDDKWRFSDPKCKVIAKKPSFQVWGSDMYSNSTIDNKPEVKRNVFNGYKGSVESNFKITGNPGATIYSSWVEEGLLLGGSATTENLASGAGTGKTSDASKANAGNSGDFCNYGTALTFSNVSGASGCASSYGMNLYPNDSEREVLIDYWTGGATDPGAASGVGTDMDLGDVASKGASIPSGSGATIRYIEPTGDLSIHGTIGKHTTVLIKSNNLVTITGDVVYENSYFPGDTLMEIPKLVIYASNVDIRCGVGEVDAIIITKESGKVRTCSDAPSDVSATARSNRLRIFGVVMADEIELGRTYGAAAWKGSGANGQQEAAEVFDFDSSILLWSEFMASSSETDTLQPVYQVEIAPRY
ncbi:MAG: hypothetical protein Q4F56_02420 [Candidatus Saccharibacteria bacterium]|nr:hypothetical protein [Candidatus Saccharibacteria bacterium]